MRDNNEYQQTRPPVTRLAVATRAPWPLCGLASQLKPNVMSTKRGLSVHRWRISGAACLFLISILVANDAYGVECWGRIPVGESAVFKIAGVEYSNCELEIRLDSEAVWLHKVSLGAASRGLQPLPWFKISDMSESPFYQDLIKQGMAGENAFKETSRARNQMYALAQKTFAGVGDREEFEAKLVVFQSDGLSKDLGIQLDWNEELAQPLVSMGPGENWATIGPELMIAEKASTGQSGSKRMCDVFDEIAAFFAAEEGPQFRAVVVSDGEMDFLAGDSWEKLRIAIGQ